MTLSRHTRSLRLALRTTVSWVWWVTGTSRLRNMAWQHLRHKISKSFEKVPTVFVFLYTYHWVRYRRALNAFNSLRKHARLIVFIVMGSLYYAGTFVQLIQHKYAWHITFIYTVQHIMRDWSKLRYKMCTLCTKDRITKFTARYVWCQLLDKRSSLESSYCCHTCVGAVLVGDV